MEAFMTEAFYKLKGDGADKDIIRRLQNEIIRLEAQIGRLKGEEAPYRFSLMKTYKSMIESRQEVLDRML
ncbi:MAG: hypothetical protein ACI843_000768 [Psychrobacter glaciei]|jgi:hypothetical protein